MAHAPGLKSRRRGNRVAWYWIARRDLVQRGWRPRAVRLRHDTAEARAEACRRMQAQMLAWAARDRAENPTYDGSMRALSRAYQIEPTSPYARIEHTTRQTYDGYLRLIERTVGSRRVDALTAADFGRWFDQWSAPAAKNGPRRVVRAHHAMNMVRGLLTFGKSMRLPGCRDARDILSDMRFAGTAPRSACPTYEQVVAVIRAAHEMGMASIAIGQALQFDLCLRQYDVIGKWEPMRPARDYPLVARSQGWWGGVLWEDIDADWRLTKRTTKNGVTVSYDLRSHTLAFAELSRVPPDRRHGPVVIDERCGLPYTRKQYSLRWRRAADAAGLPATVWNRDSRAGGATEARAAGADVRDIAKATGHLDARTTETVYLRDAAEATKRVADARAKRRKT